MPIHENTLEASVGFDFDAVDPQPGEFSRYSREDLLEVLRRYIRFIRSKDRARLTIDCLRLAIGDADVESEAMTTVAEKHGVTKAAISKRTKEIREELHLTINANNKSEHAIQQYRSSNQSPLRIAHTA